LVWTCLYVAPIFYAGLAQAFIPEKVDFWSFLAHRDYVLIVEVTEARVLREGPKRCGILHTASVVRKIKGEIVDPTIQFVSAGDIGVGTRAVLLLSNSENAGRKRDWVLETTCVRNPYRWYFGRFASDHVLPFAEALSTILNSDVVEIQGNLFWTIHCLFRTMCKLKAASVLCLCAISVMGARGIS